MISSSRRSRYICTCVRLLTRSMHLSPLLAKQPTKLRSTATKQHHRRGAIHQNDIWYTLNQSKRVDVLCCVRRRMWRRYEQRITSTRQMKTILSAESVLFECACECTVCCPLSHLILLQPFLISGIESCNLFFSFHLNIIVFRFEIINHFKIYIIREAYTQRTSRQQVDAGVKEFEGERRTERLLKLNEMKSRTFTWGETPIRIHFVESRNDIIMKDGALFVRYYILIGCGWWQPKRSVDHSQHFSDVKLIFEQLPPFWLIKN